MFMMGIPNIIPVEEDETMKLIDLDALCEEIENGKDKPKIYDGAGEADWINSCMEKAPVAYDLDKVVERLERVSVEEPLTDNGVEVGTFKVLLLKDAVEIVKGGGVDE